MRNMNELSPIELTRLNVEIENQIDSNGDLRPRPGKDSALLVVSHHATGYATFFRHDLPPGIRRQIAALPPEVALDDHQAVCQILAQHTPCDDVFAGRGYYFARPPSQETFPDALFQNGCYVILVNGTPVSWAWTADQSKRAAELAVETDANHRRCGYARQVAAAWANHVIGEGKVAFYSYERSNVASAALAQCLGVVHYAVVTTYESRTAPG